MQSTRSQTFARSDLQIRPAEPGDRAALEGIAAQTWQGEDYLPRVLDAWYADLDGGFFVAVRGEQVVGVAKLTRLAEDEWWMEGLRVDPAYQRYGVARILHHFVLNQVRQVGSGMIRFSTASMTEATQILARETGFEHVASFVPYEAEALSDDGPRLARLAPADAERVMRWLAVSPGFAHAQCSFAIDWTFYRLTEARLAERLAAGLVYGWQPDGEQLAGLALLTTTEEMRWPEDDMLKLAYLDGDPAALADLGYAVRRLAAEQGRKTVYVKMVRQPDRLVALENAGFAREWDAEVWLFARSISLTTGAGVRTDDLPPVES